MAEVKPKRGKARLTREQWHEIRLRYETKGNASEIAREFGLTPGAISNRAKRHGWKRRSVELAVAKAAEKAVTADLTDERVRQIKEYMVSNTERMDRYHKGLDALVFALNNNAQKVMIDTSAAITRHKEETKKAIAKAHVDAKARGIVEGRVITVDESEIKLPKLTLPSVGNAPYQMVRLVRALDYLDKMERRLLGLDGAADPGQFDSDPMEKWLGDLEDARRKFE